MKPLTIREHFERVTNRIKRVVVIGVVILVVFLTWYFPRATWSQGAIFAVLGGLLLGIGLSLLLKTVYKCPRCGGNLRQTRPQQQPGANVRDARSYWERWDSCPTCGVRFDEPYLSGPTR